VFYYETSLEMCISIFSALPHAQDSNKDSSTIYVKWSTGFTWFFSVTFCLFLVGITGFMFVPCPDPE
jgi:hypothetical protein